MKSIIDKVYGSLKGQIPTRQLVENALRSALAVDDVMVERALDGGIPWNGSRDHMRPLVRKSLQAALFPPEPEIPVTEEMKKEGRHEMCLSYKGESDSDAAARIYRAMRALEPKVSICGELQDGA